MEKITGIQVDIGDFKLKKVEISKDKIATISFEVKKQDNDGEISYKGKLTPNYRANEVLGKVIPHGYQ